MARASVKLRQNQGNPFLPALLDAGSIPAASPINSSSPIYSFTVKLSDFSPIAVIARDLD